MHMAITTTLPVKTGFDKRVKKISKGHILKWETV